MGMLFGSIALMVICVYCCHVFKLCPDEDGTCVQLTVFLTVCPPHSPTHLPTHSLTHYVPHYKYIPQVPRVSVCLHAPQPYSFPSHCNHEQSLKRRSGLESAGVAASFVAAGGLTKIPINLHGVDRITGEPPPNKLT